MLTQERRSKLDNIVQQMLDNGEDDTTIRLVIDDFKGKYEVPTAPVIGAQATQPEPAMQPQERQVQAPVAPAPATESSVEAPDLPVFTARRPDAPTAAPKPVTTRAEPLYAEIGGYGREIAGGEPTYPAEPTEPEPGLQPIKALREGAKDVARSMAAHGVAFTETEQAHNDRMRQRYEDMRAKGVNQIWIDKQLERLDQDKKTLSMLDKAAEKVAKANILKQGDDFKKAPGLRGYLQDVIRTAPQIATQVAATAAGGPTAGVMLMGAQISGGSYEQLRQQGVDPERAAQAALANAMMQAPLEQIGLNKAMQAWKPSAVGKKILKDIIESGATEFLTEAIQKYPEAITTIWANSKGNTAQHMVQDFVKKFWQITKDGLYEGIVAAPFGMLTAGAGSVANAPKGVDVALPAEAATATEAPTPTVAAPTPDVAPAATIESPAAFLAMTTEDQAEMWPSLSASDQEAIIQAQDVGEQLDPGTVMEPAPKEEEPAAKAPEPQMVPGAELVIPESATEETEKPTVSKDVLERIDQSIKDMMSASMTPSRMPIFPVGEDIEAEFAARKGTTIETEESTIGGIFKPSVDNLTKIVDTIEQEVTNGSISREEADLLSEHFTVSARQAWEQRGKSPAVEAFTDEEFAELSANTPGELDQRIASLDPEAQQAILRAIRRSLAYELAGKSDGILLRDRTVTARSLVTAASSDEVVQQIQKLTGGISDERFDELGWGEPFKNNDEKIWYGISSKYSADLERAAKEKDTDEVNRIFGEIDKKLASVRKRRAKKIVPSEKRSAPRRVDAEKRPGPGAPQEKRTASPSAVEVAEKLTRATVQKYLSPKLGAKVTTPIVAESFEADGETYTLSAKQRAAVWEEGGLVRIALWKGSTPAEMANSLVHEIPGHYGALSVLGQNKEIDKRIDVLFRKALPGKKMQELRELYKNPKTGKVDRSTLKREWIASQMEAYIGSDKPTSVSQKVWQAVKDYLVSIGIDVRNVEDVMRDMVKEMKVAGAEGGADVQFQRKAVEAGSEVQPQRASPKSSPYRYVIPKPRGGVYTKDKIRRYIKGLSSQSGTFSVFREIAKFDSAEEFGENLFYHGTGGRVSGGLKPSIVFSEAEIARRGGGGYGERYWGASVSQSKDIASNFTAQSSFGSLYPVILKKGAAVEVRPDIEDAAEVEGEIEEFWARGVDAVKIGDWTKDSSEKEMVILNPSATFTFKNTESFYVFKKKRFSNLSAEEIESIYNKADSRVAELDKIRREPKEGRENAGRALLDDVQFQRKAVEGANIRDGKTGQSTLRQAQTRTQPTTLLKSKDIEQLYDEAQRGGDAIFVRWSRGPVFDRQMAGSRDFVSGTNHGGISAVEVGNWGDEYMKKRLKEYGFLRMKDPEIRPWVYRGNKIGVDSDGYALIDPKTINPIGEIDVSDIDPDMKITPEIAEKVQEGGLPLFQKKDNARKAVEGAKKKRVVASKKQPSKKVADLPPEPPQGGEPTESDDMPEIAGFVKPETKIEAFQRRVQDKFNRLSVVQKQISEGLNERVPEEMDAYLQQEIVHGKVESQMEDFESKHIDPLIRAVKRSGLTIEQVEDYLYARHARERNAHIDKIRPDFAEQGIPGSGMSNEEADAILKAAQESGKEKALYGIALKIRAINEAARGILEDSGLISQEERAAWGAYRFYVPLRGVGEKMDEKVSRARIGRGFDIRGPESKRALGRRSKASNILANTVLQMNQAIARAEKNRVSQAFLKYVQAHPDKNLWEVDEVKYEPRFDKAKGEVVYRPDPRYKLSDNVLGVKVGGKQHHITIKDPALAAAMKNLGAEKTGKALQMLGAFNRYMSMIHTQLNPDFALANFSRDIQTTVINIMGEDVSAKEAMSQASDIVKGIGPSIRAVASANGLAVPGIKFPRGMTQQKFDTYYQEFRKAGGRVGFFGLKDLDKLQTDLTKRLADLTPGNKQKARLAFRKVKDFVMSANDAVENATRLSTYVVLRERGASEARAASAAKNITVNFNKKGELGTAMNALWVFSNAGVQGSARLFKALKNPRVQKIAGGIVVGSMSMAMLNRYLGGDDDDDGENYYDKIPMWIKENNLILMRPGGGYFKIPVPYGYNVFWAVGQAMDKVIHNPETAVQTAGELTGAVVNAFNPMGGELGFSSKKVVQSLSPTITRPVVDIALNENFFGAPIYKEQRFGPPKAKSHQFFKSTSEVSKTVAQSLNEITGGHAYKPGWADVSPDVMDYVAEYLAGGMGKTLNRGASSIAKATTGKPVSVKEIPVVRRFLGEVDDRQETNNFYDSIEKVQQAAANHKYLLETDKLKAKKFMAKNRKILALSSNRDFTRTNIETGEERTYKTTQINVWLRDFKDLHNRRKKFDMAGKTEKVKELDEQIARKAKQITKKIKDRME